MKDLVVGFVLSYFKELCSKLIPRYGIIELSSIKYSQEIWSRGFV